MRLAERELSCQVSHGAVARDNGPPRGTVLLEVGAFFLRGSGGVVAIALSFSVSLFVPRYPLMPETNL